MDDTHPFSYGSLSNFQIRLFKLDHDEADAPLSGTVITFRLPVHDDFTWKNAVGSILSSDAWRNTEIGDTKSKRGFDALSYVWGDADRIYPLSLSAAGKVYIKNKLSTDKTITSRGIVGVRHNLYTLLHLLRRTKYDRFIWIDSICIDQDNQPEKGAQIPLMRHIYREANNLLVWLGEASQTEEGAIAIIPAITSILKQAKIDNHLLNPDDPGSFEAIRLPEPAHAVWPALGSVMNRSYFRRLWTLQEVVLPRKDRINILCGGRQISWQALHDFGYAVSQGFRQSIANWTITGNQLIEPIELNGYSAIITISDCRTLLMQSTNTTVLGGGIRLPQLVLATRQREATNPADKIFGILGMAPQGLGKSLNLDTCMSPIDVFVAFARYYLRNEVAECLLNHVASKDKMSGLPSWCPNFNSPDRTCSLGSLWRDDLFVEETSHSRRYHAGFGRDYTGIPVNEASPRTLVSNIIHRRHQSDSLYDTSDPRQLSLLDDLHRICATGMTIDVMTQIVPYNAGIQSFTTSVDAIRQTLEWESLCRSLAILTIGATDDAVPEAYWRTLIANQICTFIREEFIMWDADDRSDLLGHYHLWKDYMHRSIQENKPLPLKNSEYEGHDFWFCLQVPRIFRERCFFVTRNGWLGIGPKTMEVGDEIAVFFYCPTPYALRRKADMYEFVGETYVHGLMYGEALRMLEKGEVKEQSYVIR